MVPVMVTLTTPRLTLSTFQESDWPFFLRLRQDPDNMRYMADIAAEDEVRHVFFTRLNNSGAFVIRRHHDATPLGDLGLRISSQNPLEADVGYSVVSDAQGQGIASEALRALCEYAFAQTGVTALNAYVLAENRASQRVLEKLGFVQTDVLPKVYRVNGVFHDDCVYRLERADFK